MQGIKMGVTAIDEVMGGAKSDDMRQKLCEFKTEHETLKGETETELVKMGADIKEPSVMAKGMSWIKTNMQMAMNESDKTIANIMTDGCNMGIKNLNKYLNEYGDADSGARGIAKRLIDLEERMTQEMSMISVNQYVKTDTLGTALFFTFRTPGSLRDFCRFLL